MHQPSMIYMIVAKHILCYVKGSLAYGIWVQRSVAQPSLIFFSEADCTGHPDNHWSTSLAPILSLGLSKSTLLLLALMQRQSTNCDLGIYLGDPTYLYCDNISSLYMLLILFLMLAPITLKLIITLFVSVLFKGI